MYRVKIMICAVGLVAQMTSSIALAQRSEPAIGTWVLDSASTESAILARKPLQIPANFGMLGYWGLFVYEMTPAEAITRAYSMDTKLVQSLVSCTLSGCTYAGVVKGNAAELKVVFVDENHVKIYAPNSPEAEELIWKRSDKFSTENVSLIEANKKAVEWISAMERIQKVVSKFESSAK